MSTEATSTKVGDLKTKLGLDSVTESGGGNPLKGATAAVVGIAAGVATSMCYALTLRRFRMYRRARWNGQEEALCDQGLAEVCHGIGGVR